MKNLRGIERYIFGFGNKTSSELNILPRSEKFRAMNANSRRQFLVSSAALLGANFLAACAPRASVPGPVSGTAPPRLPTSSGALEGSGRKYFSLIIDVPGGMDVTLGLDPWLSETRPDPAQMLLEYRADEVYRQGSIALGPAALPLKTHLHRCAIINGIYISSLDYPPHIESSVYMASGGENDSIAHFPIEMAHSGPVSAVGPVFNIEPNLAGRQIGYVTDAEFKKQLSEKEQLAEKVQSRWKTYNRKPAPQGTLKSLSSAQATLAAISKGNPPTDAQIAAALFRSGASYDGFISFSDLNLDTHENHVNEHLKLQRQAWERVADIFVTFKSIPYDDSGVSLFDRTCFVVVSEFSRKTYLNDQRGKDHNGYTNSILLAGGPVVQSSSFGSSRFLGPAEASEKRPMHVGNPVSFDGLAPARLMKPENIWPTIASVCGVQSLSSEKLAHGVKIPGLRT